MPIYEYFCHKCSETFEKLEMAASAPHEAICPKCGQRADRKISRTSYLLTGSGFHNTDYKKAPACPNAEKSGPCAQCPASKPA